MILSTLVRNELVEKKTKANLRYYESAGEKEIERRLRELDQEWDIERVLEANAAGLSLAGFVLGRLVHRRWYFLPAIVAGFLLQHSLKGSCVPADLLRRYGVRTSREIDEERAALKALRGDFELTAASHEKKGIDQLYMAAKK